MAPMMKTMGYFHNVDVGAKRYVDAVLGENSMDTYKSGTFVASKKGTSGKLMDQAKMRRGRKYADVEKQDAAFAALQQYA